MVIVMPVRNLYTFVFHSLTQHIRLPTGTAVKLNEFNFLSKQGSKALQAYQAFALGDDQNEDSFMKKAKRRLRKYREATEQNVDKILESHDVDRDEFVFCSRELFQQLKSSKKKSPFSSDVSGFLNRLLGMKISSQNMILELYENVLRNVVSIDKQQGSSTIVSNKLVEKK